MALKFMVYNFCRIHATLGVTPAIVAGVTDRLWDVEDIVDLIEDATPVPGLGGPYKRRSLD